MTNNPCVATFCSGINTASRLEAKHMQNITIFPLIYSNIKDFTGKIIQQCVRYNVISASQ
jgi:hypothetical protein